MTCFNRSLQSHIMLALSLVCCRAGFLPAAPPKLEDLAIFKAGYPRVFFFRQAEGFAANGRIGYPIWEKTFDRLMGIIGKVLDEEVPGRSKRNIDFFTRFKQRHPDQLVLLHYNGNARDPRYQCERFFAGHWVYYNGARILKTVPAVEGVTTISVNDASLFRVQIGRYRRDNEDIGLCALDAAGRPDWHRSEQVQLVEVDVGKNVLKVRRGCYGTKPRRFEAGRAHAAAHASEGPWGRKSHLLWMYNYATTCPRDKQGRTCADILVADLARRFLDGGELAAFDGLEFDVLMHERFHTHGGRGADCDGDGRIDNGWSQGVNVYGVGVTRFCKALRARLGADRLILADGHSSHHQRAFHILNGIESEGWPALNDWKIHDWSGGLNRQLFWAANGSAPPFSYVNHKFITHGAAPGVNQRPEVPFNIHRLVFAASVFTDSAICYSFTPPAEPGEIIGIWDEFCRGTEKKLGYLGKPLGPAMHMAKRTDVLVAKKNWLAFFRDHVKPAPQVAVERNGNGIRLTARGGEAGTIAFQLRHVPCNGPDLFVSMTARGNGMKGYPKENARLVTIGIAPPEGMLTRASLPSYGFCLRGEKEKLITEERRGYFRWYPRQTFNGKIHASYFLHPPYLDGPGYTFWRRHVMVPEKGRLDFYLAMGVKSPERSDGVVFQVFIQDVSAAASANAPVKIFEHTQKAARWTHHQVPLEKWAGRRVALTFVSDCGKRNNSTTDHSYWGDVRVLGPAGEDGWTRPVNYMSWLGQRDFSSTAYFSDVKPPRVDLSFTVEGTETVVLSGLRIAAHPDAMVRLFEHGIVLANPSPRPYTFDLENICPGRKFRRLSGTSRQDRSVNNGRPVKGPVTLGPKDALFLVCRDESNSRSQKN